MLRKNKNNIVSIVTITYNSSKALPKMLSTVDSRIPIIIVDNASKDINEIRKVSNKKNITLIENTSNIGFGAACNLGALNVKTEFVLFLNPDATLYEGTINAFLKAKDKYLNFSAMNPRIIRSDNKPFFKRRSHLLSRSLWMNRGWPSEDVEVPILSGSALFLKLEYFLGIGGFDENIFLFHEDDDISLRLEKKYGPLMFINDAVIKHDAGNSSVRSNKTTALKAWHMGKSKIYTIKKYKITLGKTKAILYSLFKLISPECIFSKRRRIKNYYFFKGIIDKNITFKN